MGNVLSFPRQHLRLGAFLSGGAPYYFDVHVVDVDDPEATHWEVLRLNFRAAGLRANKGFTQRKAVRGTWHSFKVGKRALAVRYLRESYRLRVSGLIEVRVDDVKVPVFIGRRASAA